MPRVPIFDTGQYGIVHDVADHTLPPEVWTEGKNVRFLDNRVQKISGDQLVYDPPSVAPYFGMSVKTAAGEHLLYFGLAAIYSVQGGTHTVRTRTVGGAYTGAATDFWNGGVLGGIPVFTNGKDAPQFWATIGTGTLENLTNWPSGYTCRVIRPFKNFLVAYDIDDGVSRYPYRVRWSHPAEPGAVPSSWDIADATKDAGEVDLGDTEGGVIQTAMQLRDGMVVYKSDSCWLQTFIGGRFIMRFQPLFSQLGALGRYCALSMPNDERHFVFTGDDLVVHNGQQVESILNRKMKRWLLNMLSTDEFEKSYCVQNEAANEMWLCFPSTNSTVIDMALIWNYRDNTLSVRELSGINYITPGVITEAEAGLSWDSDSASWNSDTEEWGQTSYTPALRQLIGLDADATKIRLMDSTNQFSGVNYTSYIQRSGLSVIGVDRLGQPKSDSSRRKIVRRIWPRLTGGPVMVRVGKQEVLEGPITWMAAKTFTPGVDRFVDCYVNGALLALRFESTSDNVWALEGYELDIELLGDH